MTFKEAAYFILKREKRPMTVKEIVEIALKEGLIKTSSKSPDRDMAVNIYDDIRLNGKNSPFVKVGRGLFGLREFEEQERKTTTEGVEHLTRKLKETQYRSNSPSEFEEVLKEAFSFLGFETDLIATPGNTDVVLKANIGHESYTVNVDGKTSKSGKISDVQIDWLSLEDHKGKTDADFVVVVGPDFAKGNVEKRAHKSGVVLLKVKDLIELLKEHIRYPFNLLELKRLFETPGDAGHVVEEIISAHRSRTHFLENLKLIVEEMDNLQSVLGYFTVDSLVARTVEKKLEPQMIKSVIDLLNSPLIKAVEEVSEGKYVLIMNKKNLSRVFKQMAGLFEEEEKKEEREVAFVENNEENKKLATKYFKWEIKNKSVVAWARKENPYQHFCPLKHFHFIIRKIVEVFKNNAEVSSSTVFSLLEGEELVPGRPFRGKSERYKMDMALGILELEGFIEWTGKKMPVTYRLKKPVEEIEKWVAQRFGM
ncbi:winged helix-turn-helix domain-containing protein [Thermotoga sp. SG1]|uniref:winged helix-turn-helix domain-containing protein n=1 Tax=Thermotoga sp. SG1 TaxID=126739 RepID=UPI000C75B63C|nr:winged helix-turn-helix domain-containing protein [Thermotoga sp. SG1]PLV56041.1 hypothetical protein AS006_05610 [Thermotoga sp. SG1]